MSLEICLDANVFVASLVPHEADHSFAYLLIQRILKSGIPLFEPSVVLSEVVATIYRKVFDRELLEERRDPLIELFFELPLLIQWQPLLMKKATRIAQRLSLRRVNDCMYLALAMEREIPLVTLDDDLIRKGRRVYKKIHSVKQFPLWAERSSG